MPDQLMENVMPDTRKEHIQNVVPYEPGKPIEEVQRELGLKRVIKLASNENPLGTSKKVVRALKRFAKNAYLYPDGGSYHLKRMIAERYGIREKELLLGNGSNEIIEFLIRGFSGPGTNVISSEKSFLVYDLISQICGAQFIEVKMKDHGFDTDALLEAITPETRLIFIANPNNPTGTYIARERLEKFLDKVPEHVIVCLDEAYWDFADAPDYPDGLLYVKLGRRNLVVLRTFSKSMGLAGLRLGFGAGHPEIIDYISRIRQPFNVNAAAQCAGLAVLEDEAYIAKSKAIVIQGRQFLYRKFESMELEFVRSQANFVLVKTGAPAERVFKALLKQGIIVRSMAAYGLLDYVRVSVGTPRENRIFVAAMKRLVKRIRKGEEI